MSCSLLIGILCFFFFYQLYPVQFFLYFKSYTLFQVVLFFSATPKNLKQILEVVRCSPKMKTVLLAVNAVALGSLP